MKAPKIGSTGNKEGLKVVATSALSSVDYFDQIPGVTADNSPSRVSIGGTAMIAMGTLAACSQPSVVQAFKSPTPLPTETATATATTENLVGVAEYAIEPVPAPAEIIDGFVVNPQAMRLYMKGESGLTADMIVSTPLVPEDKKASGLRFVTYTVDGQQKNVPVVPDKFTRSTNGQQGIMFRVIRDDVWQKALQEKGEDGVVRVNNLMGSLGNPLYSIFLNDGMTTDEYGRDLDSLRDAGVEVTQAMTEAFIEDHIDTLLLTVPTATADTIDANTLWKRTADDASFKHQVTRMVTGFLTDISGGASASTLDVPQATPTKILVSPTTATKTVVVPQNPLEATPPATKTPEVTVPATTAPTKAAEATKAPTKAAEATPTTAKQTFEQWAQTSTPDAKVLKSVESKYAKAMGLDLDKIQTATKMVDGQNGKFAKIIDQNTGVVLFVSNIDGTGQNSWTEATPGLYWSLLGKYTGVYLNGDELKIGQNKSLVTQFFGGGMVALNGQVRPGPDITERKPSGANSVMQLARSAGMGVDFHFIAEPGKYPKNISKDNVDTWLDTRLSETADVISTNKSSKPTLIEYNEGWSTKKAAVNEEKDPLKDKHGDKWAEEYIYRVLLVFVNKGLTPNKDFIIGFNENRMYNNPEKQNLIHTTLVAARANAFNRLISNQKNGDLLKKMRITKAEDIQVWLGAETHTKVDQQEDNGIFIPDPSPAEIEALANRFSDLGGVLMTEVNPQGTPDQQANFIRKTTTLLEKNNNLHGLMLFNVFNDPSDETDKTGLQTVRVELFNADGSPTALYYSTLTSQ